MWRLWSACSVHTRNLQNSKRRSEEHTSELQSPDHLVCRLLLEVHVLYRYLHSFPTRRSSDLYDGENWTSLCTFLCSPLASVLRMLAQTLDYLDHFARFKQKENVEAVERLLSAHKELAKFEKEIGRAHV